MTKMPRDTIQERVPKAVYRLRVESERPQGLELAWLTLLTIGFKEGDLIRSVSNGRPALELFDEAPDKLKKAKGLFDRLGFKGISVDQRRLKPEDWLTRWKSGWRPAALTRKLDVVPVWWRRQYKRRRGRDFILMDTLLSFGTGLHETTQIIAQFIEDQEGSFKSFFDIGSGTGILAFVALKYGAQDVLGIDIGELSVEAALKNMRANDLYFKIQRADIHQYRSKHTYDFVAANLITEDLIKDAGKIISFVRDGGSLAVSGISLANLNKLRRAFSAFPLRCMQISKGKQWAGILYQKKMS